MDRRSWLQAGGGLGLVLAAGRVLAETDQEKLAAAAATTLAHFFRDPDMSWFQERAPKARAVLIAPEIVKAGFIIGGSGGRGALIAKDPKTGKWAGPAFYSLATGSIGFQAGLQVAETVMLVMTEKGLNSLLSTSMKVGGDASIAAGPVGAGAKQEIVTDMVSFARAKGLYGGLNLDGTVVSTSDDWNSAYYKKAASPADILIRRNVSNAASSKLLRIAAGGAAR